MAESVLGEMSGLLKTGKNLLRSIQRPFDILEFLSELICFKVLQESTEETTEQGVDQPHHTGQNGGEAQCKNPEGVVKVGASDGSREVRKQHRQQDYELTSINLHLCAVQDAQLGAPTALSEEEHGDAACGRPDVCHCACHVRGADDGPKVRSAHGILKTTGNGCQGGSHGVAADEHGREEQNRVANESEAITALAPEVHLVLVDENTTEEGAEQEREEYRD
mmetsp:Transcript_17298/g.37203  ORF Transcript_17298/g.37203 Transcript_17298/m.37203 type:complete len:222 (+) Transcript_17298:242-907(+)